MEKKTYPLLTKDFNEIFYAVLENGFLKGDANWCYPNTISPYHRMYFFIDGEAVVRNKKEEVYLKPGFVYLIPANTTYDYQCHSTMEKFYLHFELQALPGLDMFKSLEQILAMPYDATTLDLIRVYASDPTIGGLVHLKALLLEHTAKFLTLAMALSDFFINYSGYYNQKEALAYIDANLSTQLKVEEIANALHLSPSVFARTFKEDIGVGVKRYIEMQILKKSKVMLLEQGKSIKEIADAFDFCDAYYFSRFFKKFEKVPPREYRKRMV